MRSKLMYVASWRKVAVGRQHCPRRCGPLWRRIPVWRRRRSVTTTASAARRTSWLGTRSYIADASHTTVQH